MAIMCDLTLNETLLAKSSFERHANGGGVNANSYQVNNGWFADAGLCVCVCVSGLRLRMVYCNA